MKVEPFPCAFRLRLEPPAVHLCQRIGDREAESQAAMATRRRAVCLPETIEDVRQEIRVDADSCVRSRRDALAAVDLSVETVTFPPGSVNLMAFESKVPGDLLESHRLTHDDKR